MLPLVIVSVAGTLPPSFTRLTALKFLDLSYNNFTITDRSHEWIESIPASSALPNGNAG